MKENMMSMEADGKNIENVGNLVSLLTWGTNCDKEMRRTAKADEAMAGSGTSGEAETLVHKPRWKS